MRESIKFIKEVYKGKEIIGAEIGVEKGQHAIEIWKNLNLKKLYLIDIWNTYHQKGRKFNFKNDYENVKSIFKSCDNVKVIKGKSTEIVEKFDNETFDFVYIDANHQYEFIKKDLQLWIVKVKTNGYLCGHDYSEEWDGVKKAVNEFAKKNNYKLNYKQNEGIGVDWWIKKE